MKETFSFITSTLTLVFIILVASAFITMELTISNARAFHANVIDRVQSSLYSESVMQECREEAVQLGYKLTFENVTIYDERRDVKVTLEYTVPGWLITESQTGVLSAYAR